MDEYQKKVLQQYQNKVNNAQGHHFESYIKAACLAYNEKGIAYIEKIPEPFRVTKKHKDGTFTGRFIANAQPDFMGTLSGGRAICFEAKYTRTDNLKRNILTQTQMLKLEEHNKVGAIAAVCAGIKDNFFFIPWSTWKDMKEIYGRQYVKTEDIERYRVRFTGAVMFLNFIHNDKINIDSFLLIGRKNND